MAKASCEGVAKIRNNMEELMASMLALKRDGKDAKTSVQLRELVTEASVMFVDLRRANREILQEEDRIKLETEAAKAPIDHTTLQLHNLLYEKNYYVKAIKACKDFKSKYPDIDLVSEEAFFQDAPQEFQSDPALRDDHHKLMLQLLNFELHQRKELLKQREGVEARKKVLQENIANRRKFLASLVSHLKALKKATLPVQQQLGILHTKRSKQNSLAELLPPPLYLLYTELQSHKEAFGEAIELDIVGSGKDALTLARHLAMKEAGRRLAGSSEGKHDEELPEDDDDSQRRRKRAKKSHDKESLEGENVYQSHPLAITIQIYDEKQRGSKLLTLRVEFLTKLNVLVAGEEGTSPGGVAPGLSLVNLFPDDSGLELPNQTTKLQAGPGFKFDTKRPLRPYKWIQHLGGKDILPDSLPLLQDNAGHGTLATYRQQYRVQNVLQQLRARRKAQLALKEQLDSLGKLRRPAVKSDPALPWTLHTPKTTLRSWAQVDRTGRKPSSALLALTVCSSTLAANTDIPIERDAEMLESEGGKEDGELPSTVVTSAETDTDATLNGSRPASGGSVPVGTKTGVSGSGAVAVAAPGVVQESNIAIENKSLVMGELPAVGQGQDSQPDEEMGEQTDHTGEDGTVVPSTGNKSRVEFGTRTFIAVFRRENGPSGKRIEVEAQVNISLEYPISPPLFCVRFTSGVASERSLPAASDGVLAASEDSAVVVPSADQAQNDLRAMEDEVNTAVTQKLPTKDQNHILAHQIAALMMLIDNL